MSEIKIENSHRTAIVTGASRGIGRATAIRLAADGMNVVINYSGNKEKAEETAKLCKEQNQDIETLVFKADVSVEEEVQSLVDATVEKFGTIDVLVNNAGITRDGLLLRMTADDFDSVIAVNLRSAFLMSKYVSKIMMKKRYGRIVSMSSVVGLHGNAGQVNYSASKAGIIGMTKSIAKELASRNITANAVAPGFIATDMTDAMPEAAKEKISASIPMGRMGTAEEIADAVAFLASDSAAYITGQVIEVSGGMG